MENTLFSLLTCIVTLCGITSPSQTNNPTLHELNNQVSETHAYITTFSPQDSKHAEVSLDFVGVFYDGKKEYQRYLKAGYPKIEFSTYESATAGGMAIFNHKKTLRKLYTVANTVYEAYCTESPYKNTDGIVLLNQQEFMAIQKKSSVNNNIWQALHQKHGNCVSQEQNLVKITYTPNQKIKKISLIWLP